MQISWRMAWMAVALVGCAVRKADPSRVIASVPVEVTEPTPVAAPPEVSSWSYRRGVWDKPPVLQRPEQVWSIQLPGPVTLPLNTDGELIYVVSDGNVYAIDVTGSKHWTARIGAAGLPVPYDLGIAVALTEGGIVLLRPSSGQIVLKLGDAMRSRSATLFFQDAWVWITVDGIFASSGGDRIHLSSAPMSDIAADDDHVFVGTSDGEAFAVDRSGIIWAQEIPGPIVGHPVVGDTLVYFAYGPRGSESGGVAALNLQDGALAWDSRLGSAPAAAPALGSVLVVPSRASEVIAIDPQHGGTRWRSPGYGTFTVTPAISGHTVYAGNADGRLHRIDIHDGGEAWSVDLGATITGDPLLLDGLLVVGLADGRLVGLR